MIDFDRAKMVGLNFVTEWLPEGRKEGCEWKAKNPTRFDSNIGSFSVNLNTGKWGEFNGDAAGGDAISLYAYIFRSKLKGTNEGQIQLEAAKDILRIYDGQTFNNTNYSPPKDTGPWSGYHCLSSGIDNPPELNTSYYEDKWGKFDRSWDFHSKAGKVVLKVARFLDLKNINKETGKPKKNDRPFTLWTNGSKTKWRSKTFSGGILNPLYNLPGLQSDEANPVLMTEGQKNAADAISVLKGYFVTTALFQGPGKTDLEPLRGRKVYIWADPDASGRKKASQLKKLLLDMDCRVMIIHSPDGKVKWDISDAIKEGWSTDKLVNYIKEFQDEREKPKTEEEFYLDDGFPFKIVGALPGYIYIYSDRSNFVERFRSSALTKGALLTLMSLSKWSALFPGEKGPNWDNAVDEILKEAEKAPIWDDSLVRGPGVWRDVGGKVVVSTGSYLIVDGQKKSLIDVDSKYVYRKTGYKPYSVADPMDNEESSHFIDIFKLISFQDDLQRLMLAGWAFLAPFGGLLEWRPNVWLTGDAGSGKSWVQKMIINELMEWFSEKVSANGTTEAGIRQRLNNCAMPITIDEMESNDKSSKETIRLLLTLARQSSTGGKNAPEILKGSSDNTGASFKINSMFFFTSILAAVEHGADEGRIEVLELVSPDQEGIDFDKRDADFELLKVKVKDILTPDFKSRFYSRALNIIEETMKAVDVFVSVSAKILKSQRSGDQKGTLLAGAYMITHDVAPTPDQAILWAEKFDFKSCMDNTVRKSDAERCFDSIMSHHVDLNTPDGRYKQTIGMWLEEHFNKTGEYAECCHIPKHLQGYGVRINDDKTVDIASAYGYIKKILRETPWESTYGRLLKRHPMYVKDCPTTQRFNGSGKSITRIKIDDCPF